MSRILNSYSGDYKVKVQSGGTITFDTGSTVINATQMVSGLEYTIVKIGTTNFTLVGSDNNIIGTTFKATGAGTGTGTVSQPAGNVVVIGNLEVKGVTTTVESTNTTISDNILVLNDGQKGSGISAALGYQSGISIVRGSRPDAQMLFDEQVTHFNPKTYIAIATSAVDYTITLNSIADLSEGTEIVFKPGTGPVQGGVLDFNTNPTARYYILGVGGALGANKITISLTKGGNLYTGLLNRSTNMSVVVTAQPGTFTFKTTSGFLTGIAANSIAIEKDVTKQTDLVFDMQNGIKKLRIVNSTDYWSRVSDKDDIPNFDFLRYYIASSYNPQAPGQGVAIVDRIFKASNLSGTNQVQATPFKIEFDIQSVERAKITSSGLDVDNVNIYQNTIANFTSNLVLTAGNLNVEIDGVLNLQDQIVDPAMDSGYTRLYSKSQLTGLAQTPGRTGIFFRNTVNNQDELVSKNRALLFSILF